MLAKQAVADLVRAGRRCRTGTNRSWVASIRSPAGGGRSRQVPPFSGYGSRALAGASSDSASVNELEAVYERDHEPVVSGRNGRVAVGDR